MNISIKTKKLFLFLMLGLLPFIITAKDRNISINEVYPSDMFIENGSHATNCEGTEKLMLVGQRTSESVTFPVKISNDKRYFTDSNNQPFFYQACTGWELLSKLTREETEMYLKNRAEKGFNTIQVTLLPWEIDKVNRYGEPAFIDKKPFGQPNEKYFEHVDWVLQKAEELGIQLGVNVFWLRNNWRDYTTVENAKTYGEYIAKRFLQHDNIMWFIGGDINPGEKIEAQKALAETIHLFDNRHLLSYHGGRYSDGSSTSSSALFHREPWHDYNMGYCYDPFHSPRIDPFAYVQFINAWNLKPVKPVILGESFYEDLANYTFKNNDEQLYAVRRNPLWAITCGAKGHAVGHSKIYPFTEGWQKALDEPNSIMVKNLTRLMGEIQWWTLVPDQYHEVGINGFGNFGGEHYISLAYCPEGKLALAYFPNKGKLTVDMSKFSGKAKARWIDPASGIEVPVTNDLPTKGTYIFSPPGVKTDGYNDFLLVIEIIAKTLLPAYRETVDADVEETLNKIMSDNFSGKNQSKLKVSENNRYLVEENTGIPFLFLSQTLWSITRRLSREDVVKALDICKEQGFTSVQLLAHSHYMGPNVYGSPPFENENFLRPVLSVGNSLQVQGEYDWWDHLEFIIQECIKRDMYVCLLPTWREQWNQKKALHKNNAYAYGKFVGQRYRPYNPSIIWVMGGDEAPNTPDKMAIHRELARGVATGVSGKEDYSHVMMTYHTHGPTSTADFFPENEPFMDFNTIQSGHSLENLEGMIEKTYQSQQKPVMDFEPFYSKNGQTTNEARTTIYWGIFSGGFGTSYGSWNLWHCGDRNDLAPFAIPDAFHEGFGTQISHLGKLLSSYPMQVREPNQKVLIDNQTSGLDRILACSAIDKSYALVYSPKGEPFTLDLSFVGGKKMRWQWFNPLNGEIQGSGTYRRRSNQHTFTPPTCGERFTGHDWVLIIK